MKHLAPPAIARLWLRLRLWLWLWFRLRLWLAPPAIAILWNVWNIMLVEENLAIGNGASLCKRA